MSRYDQYDARIARIMSKIEKLQGESGYKHRRNWEAVWEPAVTEDEIAVFEAEKNIRLPDDYRRFITSYASAGKQPFGRLYPFRQEKSVVEQPFPYTLDHILYFLYMTEEEMDYFDENNGTKIANHGLLTLCHEGDGMKSVLVVNSKDEDTYGTVRFYDLANDCGIMPMYDQKTGKPFHFLDWLEYWADRTASLTGDEYFSFSETVRLPEPPDNPDIIGRKNGWIK